MVNSRLSKIKIILIALLFFNILVSISFGVNTMRTHNSQYPDDFMMRYRESKYVLNHINAYDVVLGIQPIREDIGEVWGYTPWENMFVSFFLCWKAFTFGAQKKNGAVTDLCWY